MTYPGHTPYGSRDTFLESLFPYMKKLLFFIIVIAATGGFLYYQKTYYCRNPLVYDIGTFDNNFGISKEKFISAIREAEDIWEKDASREIFNYVPGAKFKINLIFDKRQADTIAADRSKDTISESRTYYDQLIAQYKLLALGYDSNLKYYNSAVTQLEQKLAVYNNKVAMINARGGATPKEARELKIEAQNLEEEKLSLNNLGEELSREASDLNLFGSEINQLARKLNIDVEIHNQRFGEGKIFEQGQTVGRKEIDIFQFEGISDLRLVLAHEFGHAIGIEHVNNPKSIMYYLMEKQDLNKPALSKEDQEALTQICTLRIPKLKELLTR